MALLKRSCPTCGAPEARRITYGRNARFWDRQLAEGTARLATEVESALQPRPNCECPACGACWTDPTVKDRREIHSSEAKDPRFSKLDRYYVSRKAGRK